jgi:hypothetical protein
MLLILIKRRKGTRSGTNNIVTVRAGPPWWYSYRLARYP